MMTAVIGVTHFRPNFSLEHPQPFWSTLTGQEENYAYFRKNNYFQYVLNTFYPTSLLLSP